MAISYRQGLSIMEMIVYTPILFMSLVLAWRHGFNRRAGWFFFILFSLARLVGNGCYLGTINYPDVVNLYIAYGVCNSVGLSPLSLGIISILSRLNDSIERKTGSGYWPTLFRVSALPAIVGMILSIVGMTTSSTLQEGINSTLTKAGIILYLVTYAILVALLLLICAQYRSIEKGEHRLVWAVIVSMPVLAVRLIYSALAVFEHSSAFNMFTGNTTVFLVMDVLEEIFIVYVLVLTGLTLEIRAQPISDPSKDRAGTAGIQFENIQSHRPHDSGATTESQVPLTTQYKRYPYRGGPIMMLIAWILNKVNELRAR